MYIQEVFDTVQEIINKEGLGYINPSKFNVLLNNATTKLRNILLIDIKSNKRKQNWMLESRNFGHYSEFLQQLLEHFSEVKVLENPYTLPDDLDFISDIHNENHTRIEKIDYSDLITLKNNIYSPPTNCKPRGAKVGGKLIIDPETTIYLHYIRRPKTAKYTYIEFNGKHLFNPSASDFQDIDMPYPFKDKIVSLIVEMCGVSLKDAEIVNYANIEQNKDNAEEQKQ